MIKEIKVLSRFEMEQFARNGGHGLPEHWYLISIHGGDIFISKHIRHIFEKVGCKGIISLEFADMTPNDRGIIVDQNPSYVLFDRNHAKRIIKFLDMVQKDIKDSVLIVHCHAGISRSGAVGSFACDYCRLDFNEFLSKNTQIQPNPHVTSVLRAEAKMTPSFGTDDQTWLDRINKILEEKSNDGIS